MRDVVRRTERGTRNGRDGLTPFEVFTVADAYLYTILRWASPNGIDIGSWPRLKAWFAAIGARPHVGAALKAEGE